MPVAVKPSRLAAPQPVALRALSSSKNGYHFAGGELACPNDLAHEPVASHMSSLIIFKSQQAARRQ